MLCIQELSHNQIRDLITTLSKERKRRYPRHARKYGNIPRGLAEQQLAAFLGEVENEKAHLAFTCMAYIGLRVSEVAGLRREQIDFYQGLLFLQTEKNGLFDCVPICKDLLLRLQAWCNLPEVRETGFLFWSGNQNREGQHISPHWLRKEFRIAARRAGLGASYGKTEERFSWHRARPLYQFTTHSLRHTFCNMVRVKVHDLEIVRALMRHKCIMSTQHYARATGEELRHAIEKSFE